MTNLVSVLRSRGLFVPHSWKEPDEVTNRLASGGGVLVQYGQPGEELTSETSMTLSPPDPGTEPEAFKWYALTTGHRRRGGGLENPNVLFQECIVARAGALLIDVLSPRYGVDLTDALSEREWVAGEGDHRLMARLRAAAAALEPPPLLSWRSYFSLQYPARLFDAIETFPYLRKEVYTAGVRYTFFEDPVQSFTKIVDLNDRWRCYWRL
jgi:hypothetical protein